MRRYNPKPPPRISIHALREESDIAKNDKDKRSLISIHALREESDPDLWSPDHYLLKFLSTLSVRRATLQGRR